MDKETIERELERLKAEQLATPDWKFWRQMLLAWRISRLYYERARLMYPYP